MTQADGREGGARSCPHRGSGGCFDCPPAPSFSSPLGRTQAENHFGRVGTSIFFCFCLRPDNQKRRGGGGGVERRGEGEGESKKGQLKEGCDQLARGRRRWEQIFRGEPERFLLWWRRYGTSGQLSIYCSCSSIGCFSFCDLFLVLSCFVVSNNAFLDPCLYLLSTSLGATAICLRGSTFPRCKMRDVEHVRARDPAAVAPVRARDLRFDVVT
jgi:hypothetical protein